MSVKLHFQLVVFVLAAAVAYFGIKYVNSYREIKETVPASISLAPPQQVSTDEPRLVAEVYFYDKQGQKLTLDAFKGKVVLVNLWATWCLPCVIELPSLDRLQQKLPADQFKVLAVSVEKTSVTTIEQLFAAKKMTALEIYRDTDREFQTKWKYDGLPTSFLFGRDGKLIKRYNGGYTWDTGSLLKEIEGHLK